jgi:glutamate N-acetyltransferase / amino-acid N-acetyltransferase
VAAAPVEVSRAAVKAGRLRGVVVNSGNANACTGKQGLRDAEEMARVAEASTSTSTFTSTFTSTSTTTSTTTPEGAFAVASTGVIGLPLPMERVRPGIVAAGRALAEDGFESFSRAILTTDKGPKVHVATAGGFTVAGCAKGAGMIAPNMATTLGFLVTDAPAGAAWLRSVLRAEAELTFNRVTVDGDTSTNDSAFLMASGAAGGTKVGADRRGKLLRCAIHEVMDALATALVRDGEGATKVVEILVAGASSERAALQIARTIAGSPLVKTAIGGADPNWGRVLGAAGRAGVPIDPSRIDLDIGTVPMVRRGVGVVTQESEAAAHAVMSQAAYRMRLDLHAGRAQASIKTCDLTHEYVSINADYRS